MKKIATISAVLLILFLSIIFSYLYFASFSTMTFSLSKEVKEIKIYKDSDDESGDTIIATLQNSGEVRASNGNYYVIPSGENIVTNKISVELNGNMSIDIDPNYNSEYLAKIAEAESSNIIDVLNKSLTPVIDNYDVEQVKVYTKANWAGALLVPKDIDTQNPSGMHRVVLKREGKSWLVVGLPQIVMTIHNTKDIPIEVLKSVNDLAY